MLLPVFENGRSFFSIYNPEREIDFFCDNEIFSKSGFFLIGGLGNAKHIKKLSEKYKNAFILAVETNHESINFLKTNFPEIEKLLSGNKNISVCTIEELSSAIKNCYIPAVHNDFCFAGITNWLTYNDGLKERIKEIISASLKSISSDYATQAKFGKLWHNNIFSNLKTISKNGVINCCIPKADNKKEAAVIGAGPTLDKTIDILKRNREKYFIFATDTAFPILVKNGLVPEVTVTIDGQNTSYHHFEGLSLKKTILAFCLSASPSVVKYAYEQNAVLFPFCDNHPLEHLVKNYTNAGAAFLPVIDCGAGTVLHAAASLAEKTGFKNISVFGADFGYSYGKAYAKGSYFDAVFSEKADRLHPVETKFSDLYYRLPLIKNGSCISTELLLGYRQAFYSYVEALRAKGICVKIVQPEPACGESQQSGKAAVCEEPLGEPPAQTEAAYVHEGALQTEEAPQNEEPAQTEKAFVHEGALQTEAAPQNEEPGQTEATLKNEKSAQTEAANFSFSAFCDYFIEKLQKNDKNIDISMLPYAAWAKENNKNADNIYIAAAEKAARVRGNP